MKSMEPMLDQARVTLSMALSDPQLLEILARRGYGAEQLQEGMALCEIARNSIQTQGVARFSKVSATQTLQQKWKIAKFQYSHDVQSARLALKEYNGSGYLLQLNSTFPKNFEQWYAQAKDFYFTLNSHLELQTAVAKVGLSAERIAQGIQFLETLEELRTQQKTQQGSARRSRQQRDQEVEAFKRWMSDFRQYARLAFAATPSHLVTLGLEPASPKITRKIEVFQPAAPAGEPVAAQTFAQ